MRGRSGQVDGDTGRQEGVVERLLFSTGRSTELVHGEKEQADGDESSDSETKESFGDLSGAALGDIYRV